MQMLNLARQDAKEMADGITDPLIKKQPLS